MCLRPHSGVFVADSITSFGVSYRIDRDRGSDHVENLASPGYFTAELTSERSIAFVASTESWELLDFPPEAIFEAETQRLHKLLFQPARQG